MICDSLVYLLAPLYGQAVDTCIVPLTRTHLGDRSFSVAGPRLLNSLPAELRQLDVEIGQLRRLLNTFLFAGDCGA